MSRLLHIRVDGDGLKGQQVIETLTGCDLYIGPNGAGKSTRLLAVVAGLRGLAESASDEVRPYIGPQRPDSSVALVFDTGTLVRDLSDKRGDKVTRANVAAETLAGGHVVTFDLADFASASETNREALIRRVAASSAADAQMVAGRVMRKLKNETADPTFNQLLRAKIAKGGAPGGAWLEAALEWQKAAFTTANAAATKAKADADAKAGKPSDAPPGTLAGARAHLERLEGERRAVGESIATASQAASQARDHAAEGERLAGAYGRAEIAVRDLEVWRPEVGPDLEGLRGALAREEQLHTAARDAADAATLAHETCGDLAGDADHARGLLRTEAETTRGGLATLRALATEASGACQHCGCADPLDVGGRVAAVEEQLAALDVRIEEAGARWEDLDADRTIAAGASRRAQAAREDARAAQARAQATLDAGQARADRIQEDTTRHTTSLARAREALALAEEQLKSWRAREAPAGAGGDLDALIAQRDALDEAIRAARAAVEQHARHQERAKAHQEAIAAREAAVATLDEVKALGVALKAVQGEIAAETFGPITRAANEMLDSADLGIMAVFHSIGDFGASIDGRYVQFWALSDSERAIVGAAIASALIRLSGAPWKGLLLDGLERVDSARLPLLLRALAGMAAAGKLDNVLLAHRAVTPDEIPAVDGVTIHWLGADVGAREAA